MNAQDRFDAELRAWLRTKAGEHAPVDLVARGMSAVRATPQARGWRSFFAAPLSLRLTLVGAAVVAVMAAVVLFSIGPRPVPPTGNSPKPSSASASAVPTPTATPLLAFTINAPTDPAATWTSLTWRKVSDAVLSQVISATRWRGGYFAIGAANSNTPAFVSSDGMAWHPLDENVFGRSSVVVAVAETSNGLVALTAVRNDCIGGICDGVVGPITSWTSSDGVAWTAHPGPNLLPAGSQGPRPVLVGNVLGLVAGEPGTAIASTSSDGMTWTSLGTDAFPSGFTLGGLWARQSGIAAIGSVPVDADNTKGLALWSTDGVHWGPASGPLVTAMGGIVLASTGPTWNGDGVIAGRDGAIAVGHLGGAPGAELWWHSSDGQEWHQLSNYPPLGAFQGPGEGIGSFPDGVLASDGSRMIALRAGSTAAGAPAAAWVSFDGSTWTPLAMSGELPGLESGHAIVLPGGVLFTYGTDTWYGEAR